MNIVLVGPAYPLRGGIAHHATLLAKELSKLHHVEIVTFKRQYPALLFPGASQQETAGELLSANSERLIDSINPFNWITVGRGIRRKKPDLLIIAYSIPFFAPCYGVIASIVRRGPTKVVFLCHNILPHESHPGDRSLTRFAFSRADAFIVQSDQVLKELEEFRPGSAARMLRHPMYTLFGASIPPDRARAELGLTMRFVVLFFGYIRAYKGLSVLLDAMAVLRDTHGIREATLLVVGEFYEDDGPYKERVSTLGIEEIVRFIPQYVPQDKVALYFSAADVVVLPYRSASQSGIVQIAYNFDRPVIVTRVGGLAEVVKDDMTGYVIPPDNPEALANALARFVREDKRDTFIQNIKNEKGKYSWEAFAGSVTDLARSLGVKG